jgi:hypothetical protein
MLPAVVFSIGSSARSASPERTDSAARRKVSQPGEQHSARASGILPLRREMAVRAFRPLVGDAQRRGLQRPNESLLVGDRHVEDDAIEPLHLVRIEPFVDRQLAQPDEQPVLARRIAEGPGAAELRFRHPLDQIHAFPQETQQAMVDAFDRFAQRLQIGRPDRLGWLLVHPALRFRGHASVSVARPATTAAAARPDCPSQ